MLRKQFWNLTQQQRQKQQDTLGSTGTPVVEQNLGNRNRFNKRSKGTLVAEKESSFQVDLRIQGVPQDAALEDQKRLSKNQEVVYKLGTGYQTESIIGELGKKEKSGRTIKELGNIELYEMGVAGLPVCSLSTPVDKILVSYVATHEIDERPVYDHKTGARLSPHSVKVGRQTEHDAMTRHQLFERVPIAMARGKKVRCQWLDEMKEGANGPFVRSRLVAMEVAHGVRFDSFAGTAPLKRVTIIISRAASIKNTRGEHSRVLSLYDISVAFWHALLPEDNPIAMYPPRGEEEAG